MKHASLRRLQPTIFKTQSHMPQPMVLFLLNRTTGCLYAPWCRWWTQCGCRTWTQVCLRPPTAPLLRSSATQTKPWFYFGSLWVPSLCIVLFWESHSAFSFSQSVGLAFAHNKWNQKYRFRLTEERPHEKGGFTSRDYTVLLGNLSNLTQSAFSEWDKRRPGDESECALRVQVYSRPCRDQGSRNPGNLEGCSWNPGCYARGLSPCKYILVTSLFLCL